MQKLMKRFHDNQRGFTLVELMVVVVIIGILVAIAIPIYNIIQTTAETNACQANQRTVSGIYQVYRADGGAAVASGADVIGALVTGGYLAEAPGCPSSPAGNYTWDGTILSCSLPAH